jgi:hypothetical protein
MKPIWVKAWVSTWYVSVSIEFFSSLVLVLALLRRFRTKSVLVVSRYEHYPTGPLRSLSLLYWRFLFVALWSTFPSAQLRFSCRPSSLVS